jgi:[acyl-carrier-protein] S-malonyltransferase
MKFIRLPVAGAFHTDLMKPASDHLSRALTEVSVSPTRFPLFSNVDAQPHTKPEEFRALFPRQLVSPVQWETSIRNMIDAGVEEFYEIGTGRVLAGTIKRIERKMKCTNIGE